MLDYDDAAKGNVQGKTPKKKDKANDLNFAYTADEPPPEVDMSRKPTWSSGGGGSGGGGGGQGSG